ncbi:periplasmic binding protein-like I [Catenaria anguillulae PL171]|uniref:Periplasmic binding protein-like I n=1 Tax=Catenaria anguillulae PL171 TaxID=765915 RepID=A0A1Y2H7I0_9FUNG|nr:periplasmic binding protein-like I [Catenaria anguillulae PL171]
MGLALEPSPHTFKSMLKTSTHSVLAIPNGHKLSLAILDSAGSPSQAVANVFGAENGTLGMIGDLSSDLTIPMALTAQHRGIYLCSGSATAVKLSNPIEFPSFFRTTQSDTTQAIALARFIKHMQWSACVVFASTSQYGRSIARGFLPAAQAAGVDVAVAEHIPFYGAARDRDGAMARALGLAVRSGIRILVFLGTDAEYSQLARAARDVGLFGADTVWIGSDGVAPLSMSAASDASVKDITQGLLYLFPREIDNSELAKSLVERAKSKLPATTSNIMEPYAAGFCDCLGALVAMFVNTLKSDTPSPTLTSNDPTTDSSSRFTPVAQLLQPFQGLAGHIVFNSENSLDEPFIVYNMYDGVVTKVFTIDSAFGTVDSIAPPRYFSGTFTRPLERPSWVISFVRYFSPSGWLVLVVSGLLAVAIVGCSILTIVHRRTVYVREHSLTVLLIVAVGLLLVLSAPISWLDQQTAVTCNVGVWVSGVGTQLVVLPLLYRTFQVCNLILYLFCIKI